MLRLVLLLVLCFHPAPALVPGGCRGSPPRTTDLPCRRATSVLQHLLAEHDLRPERFSVAAYAEHRPVRPNDTRRNRARNPQSRPRCRGPSSLRS